jgi:tight adherence protein B
MRKLLVLAAAALAVAAPTAGAAVSVRGLDTSRLPLVRLTVAADSTTPGKPPAFIVTENGNQVGKVDVGAPSDASAIVLAIDTSGSMKGAPNKEALGAAGQFLASVKPNDQVAIVTFGHTAQVIQPLTSDTASLASALAATTSDHTPGTALNDAVSTGVKELATAPAASRRVLIVMTDGVDSSSLVPLPEATKAAIANEVSI